MAVIELIESPTEAPYGVSPIPLANPGKMPQLGDALTLVGLAETSPNCTGLDHKAKVTVPLVDYENASCVMTFEDPLRHACPGDSGGPVLDSGGKVVGVMKQGGLSQTIAHPTATYYDWITTGVMSLATTTMITEPDITRGAGAYSYKSFPLAVNSASLCLDECAADGFCKAWEYKPSSICCPKKPICWLTTTIGTPARAARGRISGIKVLPANQLD